MYGPDVAVLLKYGSHDMRLTVFRRLTVVNGCKTRENSNFLKKGKMVISVKTRNFCISRMTKRTSSLELSHEI